MAINADMVLESDNVSLLVSRRWGAHFVIRGKIDSSVFQFHCKHPRMCLPVPMIRIDEGLVPGMHVPDRLWDVNHVL